jgi:hypothetical protein
MSSIIRHCFFGTLYNLLSILLIRGIMLGIMLPTSNVMTYFFTAWMSFDCLYGLVVIVPTDPEVLRSIPGATKFSEM